MEPHPIPQNVTNFEFHLVGDMTLKQFGYLGGGLLLAYIVFAAIGGLYPIIAYPIMFVFGALGGALAFIPIQERPLDHWASAYLKAIFSPTQAKYSSKFINEKNFDQRVNLYLQSLGMEQSMASKPTNLGSMAQRAPATATVTESPVVTPVTNTPPPAPVTANPTPQVQPVTVTNPTPTPEELSSMVEYAKKAQEIQAQIVESERQLNLIKAAATQPGKNPAEIALQFQQVLSNLQTQTKQASDISTQMSEVAKQPATAPSAPVATVSAPSALSSIALTTEKNVINGIVTDASGAYLEGVIVVAYDKEGLPVRALKSNKLGQFIAATPLAAGDYKISLEKEGLNFDNFMITLSDSVLIPMMIKAK